MYQKPTEKHWPPLQSNDERIPLMRKWFVWNNGPPNNTPEMINSKDDLHDYNHFLKIREYSKLQVHLINCKHYGAEYYEEDSLEGCLSHLLPEGEDPVDYAVRIVTEIRDAD